MLRIIAAAAALSITIALAPPAAAQPSQCAETLPRACLQSFGAGSIAAAEGGEEVDCGAALSGYRDCISGSVKTRDINGLGGTGFQGPPLTRAEFGFLLALEAELAENVGRVGAFVDGMDLTGAKVVYENQWPPLRQRFFNATDNPSYFVAPADWLAKAQAFYDDLNGYLNSAEMRQVYRRGTTSVLASRRDFKKRMQALIAVGRDELLPEISAVLAQEGR